MAQRRKNNQINKRYKCKGCGKAYTVLSSLRVHKRLKNCGRRSQLSNSSAGNSSRGKRSEYKVSKSDSDRNSNNTLTPKYLRPRKNDRTLERKRQDDICLSCSQISKDCKCKNKIWQPQYKKTIDKLKQMDFFIFMMQTGSKFYPNAFRNTNTKPSTISIKRLMEQLEDTQFTQNSMPIKKEILINDECKQYLEYQSRFFKEEFCPQIMKVVLCFFMKKNYKKPIFRHFLEDNIKIFPILQKNKKNIGNFVQQLTNCSSLINNNLQLQQLRKSQRN